jgi:hypothetical protein
MAQFGASIQTAQITTGNFRTALDPFVPGFAGYPNNPGERNPLGAAYYDSTGSASNPWGVPGKYRYVRYNSTINPTPIATPGPVFWTDATFTTVTGVESESLGGGVLNMVAGLMMPNTTNLPSLTAATLNGNFVWICVGGYVSGVIAATAVAGSTIIAATGNFAVTALGLATAPTNRVIGIATTATGTPAAGQINILVTLES